MPFHLVPADFAWLSDVGLREVLLSNIKTRIEDAVHTVSQERVFRRTAEKARVIDVGNALIVEIQSGKDVAEEKGVEPHHMTQLENRTIPIRTAAGGVQFRRATRLSMMLGKFKHPGIQKRETVKQAVGQALSESAEVVIETKNQLEEMNPSPRLRDVIGIR
jgi:hypothetical protein